MGTAQRKEMADAVSYEEQRRRQEVQDFGRKVRRTYGSRRKDLANRVYAIHGTC
ncbi:hypothetical protein C2845_PM14G05240 [Panicum miliaceum]|uniref:Uncharacterized protein n=1 Tax=Panicum miliaceum TaxID=4540 RepID=A0A3L6PPV7_PANMI|nr:hypothetical protein C2845_PM14G05240 [Panicum miliaceum]